ncbi:MAG: glutathione S-transferase C-terminal domain-containing protein [Myxococcota bacterium]
MRRPAGGSSDWDAATPKSVIFRGFTTRAHAIVARTDAMLGDGRNYLVGGRFTAADLSLACMLAPLVLPREYGIRLPLIAELPAPMQPAVKAFSATATGRYVLGLFRTQRTRRAGA